MIPIYGQNKNFLAPQKITVASKPTKDIAAKINRIICNSHGHPIS